MIKLTQSGRIKSVRFSISSSESIKKDSYAPVISHDLFHNNLPHPGGVYDGHFGTTDYLYRCQTCYNNKKRCIGHDGHLSLNYPIEQPLFLDELRKWLKLICFKCGQPIIEDKKFNKFSKSVKLSNAAKIARATSNKKCVHCDEQHPIIVKDKFDYITVYAEFWEKTDKNIPKLTSRYKLYPHVIKEILNKISDETVLKLGKDPKTFHPSNFILDVIKIPSTIIRPDIKKMSGGRSTNDDLTTMIQYMVKKNELIPTTIPDDISQHPKLDQHIYELNMAYYEFIKGGGVNRPGKQSIKAGNKPFNSLSNRIKGKQGRLRRNILGRRVHIMFRSTITGDPKLKINELGVPLLFAKNIQIEEVVQEFNKRRLMVHFNNKRKKYPGCTKVIKKITGTEHNVENIRDDFELENGDIIYRDMIDGDPINFNRQPSLTPSSICCHIAVITKDPKYLNLRMNVLATPWYNADFDGDQMNGIIPSTLSTRNEIIEQSGAHNFVINYGNSSPAIGQVDDSKIGMFELTRNSVKFNKYHAMLLFQNNTYLPDFSDKKIFTGRDIITKILEETPVNFTRTPSFYKPEYPQLASWYIPSEVKVSIKNGIHESGVLDSNSIGAKGGSLYHVINTEYGPTKTLEVMFNMQQAAIGYLYQYGLTIGLNDVIVGPEAIKKIHDAETAILHDANIITNNLNNGEIIPPIGKTTEQFYEEQQMNALRSMDDFTDAVLSDIVPNVNNLFKLIMAGSKGKFSNMLNIVSAVGQRAINGSRPKKNFSHERNLIYFSRFDTTPQSAGYILNSYINGMDSVEYWFNAMESRFSLITKALSTAVTGEMNRKAIKNLESIIINNLRMGVKANNIIQFIYGEDGLDPRKVINVKFPTIMSTTKEFENDYNNTKYPEEFAQLTKDRNEYRDIFLGIENINISDIMSDMRYMPVNVLNIVIKITNNFDKQIPNDVEMKRMILYVKEQCELFPYIMLNSFQEKARLKLPQHIIYSTYLMQILTRSILCSKQSLKILNMKMLKLVISELKSKYNQALVNPGTAVGIIAAQSFSEPLTQYMLDAHHRSTEGGTSKDAMSHAKEILGAKPVEKLFAPSMLLTVYPKYASNNVKVQEIANYIEMLAFRRFIIEWQIFFENYKTSIHPLYKDENAIIEEFEKMNPLLPPPGDLVKWCIRFNLNKTTMILKNMSLETIINKLRNLFPDTFIIYTPENSKKIIIRIYMKNSMFKGKVSLKDIKSINIKIMNSIIRGSKNILTSSVKKLIRSKIDTDGSIQSAKNIYGIVTSGTNLSSVMKNKYIDAYKVQTDSIDETYKMFGIEAARQKIISELRNLVASCNHRHYMIYADEMTYLGSVTAIERGGLGKREINNVMLRLGNSAPVQVLQEAGINSMVDKIEGVTGPLLIGNTPKIGTLYNQFHLNESFISSNITTADNYLDDL